MTKKFKVIDGIHSGGNGAGEKGVEYRRGDVFESDKPLHKLFRNKYELVASSTKLTKKALPKAADDDDDEEEDRAGASADKDVFDRPKSAKRPAPGHDDELADEDEDAPAKPKKAKAVVEDDEEEEAEPADDEAEEEEEPAPKPKPKAKKKSK